MGTVLTSVQVDEKLKRRLERRDRKQKPKPIGWTRQLVDAAEKWLDAEDATEKSET